MEASPLLERDLELATIEAWQQEGAGSWQSRAEFAARRFRECWGKQDSVKVGATVTVTGDRESLMAKLEKPAGDAHATDQGGRDPGYAAATGE